MSSAPVASAARRGCRRTAFIGSRFSRRCDRAATVRHGIVTIARETREMEHPAARTGSAQVLVVDDDQKIVQLVRAYLEREGFGVTTAGDGRTALALIADQSPDLIVLDLMLPELDGMSVARRVRADSDVPILMLSARGSVADRIQGIA